MGREGEEVELVVADEGTLAVEAEDAPAEDNDDVAEDAVTVVVTVLVASVSVEDRAAVRLATELVTEADTEDASDVGRL